MFYAGILKKQQALPATATRSAVAHLRIRNNNRYEIHIRTETDQDFCSRSISEFSFTNLFSAASYITEEKPKCKIYTKIATYN